MKKLLAVLTTVVLLLSVGCESQRDNELDANKNLVLRFIEISNAANWDQLAEIVAADFQRHSSATAGPPVRSLDEFISLQESFLATFPDQRVRLDKIIAEGDFVAIRAAYLGTQSGPMGDLPATGKPVEGPFIAFFRIASGKIAELWVEWDNLAMLTQLGLTKGMPPGDSAAERKKLAVEFLHAVYTGELSVVDRIAAPDIAISYPIFGEIFESPVIRGREAVRDFVIGFSERWVDATISVRSVVADGNEVVLIWEFEARSNPSEAESAKRAWGGITYYRFNESGQITLELGEESTPGPVARVRTAFDQD